MQWSWEPEQSSYVTPQHLIVICGDGSDIREAEEVVSRRGAKDQVLNLRPG